MERFARLVMHHRGIEGLKEMFLELTAPTQREGAPA
jgi:hypothetical protein